jgi:hypothetical protein
MHVHGVLAETRHPWHWLSTRLKNETTPTLHTVSIIHEILPRKCGIPRFWSPKSGPEICEKRQSQVGGGGVKPGARQPARTFWRSRLRHNPFKSFSAESQSCIHSKKPSSPTNEIKARAKLPSMPFPYLVTLLILLPFVLFRKHSGLVRHNLCGARRRVKWCGRKCAGRWAFLHRKSRLRLIFRDIGLRPISCLKYENTPKPGHNAMMMMMKTPKSMHQTDNNKAYDVMGILPTLLTLRGG